MFLNICHGLNRLKLAWLVALIRVILHMLCAPFAEEGRYVHPKQVGGWSAWLRVPVFGVIAFRKLGKRGWTYCW